MPPRVGERRLVHRDRGDLVSTHQPRVDRLGEHAAARPAGVLEKLVATVRPEFRADVLVFDPRDPVFGGACCVVSGCARTARAHGLCSAPPPAVVA
ncbi:MAG: hypothetical protein QOH50_5538 [Kribbellaceae bacterium]|jgi:hypothetical protein|nr:hypothetical protein [Kribbellaceae bacterium]